jgi:hypothetical protein
VTYCRKDITPKQRERLLMAEDRGNRALADGNEFWESFCRFQFSMPHIAAPLKKKAEKCFERSQYWLDVANKLRGMGE